MSSKQPNPPFPITLRDDVEFELHDVADTSVRWKVRRLVALAYAHGFADGALYQNITEGNDRRAERDAKDGAP